MTDIHISSSSSDFSSDEEIEFLNYINKQFNDRKPYLLHTSKFFLKKKKLTDRLERGS
jgi:hypothetical protein